MEWNDWLIYLYELPLWAIWTVFAILALKAFYFKWPAWVWQIALLPALSFSGMPHTYWYFLAPVFLILFVPLVRRFIVTAPLMAVVKKLKILPRISDTERTALRAGNTWADAELFSGKPNLKQLFSEIDSDLSEEEKAFLDGPVEELCAMVDDWEVTSTRQLPSEAWDFIKKHKFFGMIVPKEYGGLGFSALANSSVVEKLSSRSLPLAVTVMVPNSLGPAELLNHYGTQKQRDFYLPRLATGEEIPCFALTEPGAGSDANGMESKGILFKDSKGQLKIRLTWEKRYITLAAISTVLGLAFKLYDPENLLGQGEEIGITAALMPSNTPGVQLGKRHDPLGVPFYNCPTRGKDVEIPVDWVIGAEKGLGQGWSMLMESLAAGRGISLPALGSGGTKMIARITGAFGNLRRQFGVAIGRFEGVEEKMAEIGGFAYLLEANRRFILGALDRGRKPSVVTAIAKYHFTELYRKAINHGMDILAGNAIQRGPRNLLAGGYAGTPISITVEGANIMTRSLIHFGQGSVRCHPFLYREVETLENNDLKGFDAALFGHIAHALSNFVRAVFLSFTRGFLVPVPSAGKLWREQQKLVWMSAVFAFYADLGIALMGGSIKFREKISGRYGDVLSWLFLNLGTLKYYRNAQFKKEEKEFARWSLDYGFNEMQRALEGLLKNLDGGPVGWLLKGPVYLFARMNAVGSYPDDKRGHKVAHSLLKPGTFRDHLTKNIYLNENENDPIGRFENAQNWLFKTRDERIKVQNAMRKKLLPKDKLKNVIDEAKKKGILNADEAERLAKAEAYRWDACAVDEYTLQDYLDMGSTKGSKDSITPLNPG